ncbi:unnamed protein product [Blumeria hordei]|uniref:Protoheme IX farnesyltransferase, mitochondrial n=2 Tax=Blumeria hordei TaxID=2867405 RepID=A0A383UPV7_BLUHO|nr:unnamed protein product [Blumeria hordei]
MSARCPTVSALRLGDISTLCMSCFHPTRNRLHQFGRRQFSKTSNIRAVPPKLRTGYFFANALLPLEQFGSKDPFNGPVILATSQKEARLFRSDSVPTKSAILPQRQRYERKSSATTGDSFLPSNAATTLTNSASTLPKNSLRQLLSILLALSKPRLTVLVVLTACASYSLYPTPDVLLPSSTSTPSLSPLTLLFLTSGTTLCAASANTLNMIYEPKWDALMLRTRNRPLVKGLITPKAAAIFAVISGVAGATLLYYGVNPTVSLLGLLNIALYAGVYTPLKRRSVINTWVGALVGGIPPLMGWAAAASQIAVVGNFEELLLGEQNIGGWLLATLLFSWQFPHFMSLSWSIREDYKKAGYRMLSWVNPARNSRIALRYSLLFLPICSGMCYFGVTEWSFAITSTPINMWLISEAVKFWKHQGASGSARGLFWASVWHLPVVMILAMVQKKGLWTKVWIAIAGENEDTDVMEYEDRT